MLCEEWTPDKSLEGQVHESIELAFVHDSVRILYISGSLAELLGYTVQEMEGRLLVSFLSASAFVTMIQAISKNRVARITGKVNEFEPQPTRLKNKQGVDVCLQAVCSLDIPAEHAKGKKARLTVVESVNL